MENKIKENNLETIEEDFKQPNMNLNTRKESFSSTQQTLEDIDMTVSEFVPKERILSKFKEEPKSNPYPELDPINLSNVSIPEELKNSSILKTKFKQSYIIVRLLNSKVKADKVLLTTTYYELETSKVVEGQRSKYTVFRRYSDFEILRDFLKKKHPALILPLLPEKNFLTKLNQQDLDFEKKRQKELIDFIQRLCKNEILFYDDSFNSFLIDDIFVRNYIESPDALAGLESIWSMFFKKIRKSIVSDQSLFKRHPNSAEIFDFRSKATKMIEISKNSIKNLKLLLTQRENIDKNLAEYILSLQQFGNKAGDKHPNIATFFRDKFSMISYTKLNKKSAIQRDKISDLVLEFKSLNQEIYAILEAIETLKTHLERVNEYEEYLDQHSSSSDENFKKVKSNYDTAKDQITQMINGLNTNIETAKNGVNLKFMNLISDFYVMQKEFLQENVDYWKID